MSPGRRMTSPRSSARWPVRAESSGHGPTALMRSRSIRTAPSSMGGLETGRTMRARSNISEKISSERVDRFRHSLENLNLGFLARAFGAGSLVVFARLEFSVSFANLLFDFFGHQIDGGIQVALDI